MKYPFICLFAREQQHSVLTTTYCNITLDAELMVTEELYDRTYSSKL